ncbi:Hypothetical protein POVN_LOCUS425 [uncultured virus]|nr:Hypothetical protein POVN_LOCUS425 [uncultured virus]
MVENQASPQAPVESKATEEAERIVAEADQERLDLERATALSLLAPAESVTEAKEAKVIPDAILCRICYNAEKNCALNCGHTFCATCAFKIEVCAICRAAITTRAKIIL